jgi:predicted dehydrogenase
MERIRVGIVGFGGMGKMHLGVWNQIEGADVVAVADPDRERLRTGESAQEINIGTAAGRLRAEGTRCYTQPGKLARDPNVDVVDICAPTFVHARLARQALAAGKHVLCEKPMALTPRQCDAVVRAAAATDAVFMVAQCIRFWPAYEHLAETIRAGRLGALRVLRLMREGPPPRWAWNDWYADAARSGGGILDLHVHDVDFLVSVFGAPRRVISQGARGFSGGWDAVGTLYDYGPGKVISTFADLSLPDNVRFRMAFEAVFERGMLRCDSRLQPALIEWDGREERIPDVAPEDGYRREIEYFAECVRTGRRPRRCLPESTALSVRVATAERRSCERGRAVSVA